MISISACMIAKDEQELLPQCLDSIKGFVDEIILVDTGSTDDTVKIAESYGAKVYHHPWQNDFSLHRNQSIQYSTGDWIMIIDCDEQVVSQIDRDEFHGRLSKLPDQVAGLIVNVVEQRDEAETTPWLGARFFRRSSGIHYKGAVHNKSVFQGGCAGSDIKFYHYGYSLSPDKMKAKRQRTTALLMGRLSNNDKDHTALYYLTQMMIGERRYKEAEEYGLRFFACVPVHPEEWQFYGVMYFYMAWATLHLEDGTKAMAWAKKGLDYYPDDPDLNYVMARIGYQAKIDDILSIHGRKYLDILPVVRSRLALDSTKFANEVNTDQWFNRTIYTANHAAEQDVLKFMEGLN